jgi:hypothetical protein
MPDSTPSAQKLIEYHYLIGAYIFLTPEIVRGIQMLLVTMLLASLKRKPAISTQPRRYYHS